MQLTGVAVLAKSLESVPPNTVLMVISDDKGIVKIIKIDHDSMPTNEPLLRVKGGCWVIINGKLEWKDPCPY